MKVLITGISGFLGINLTRYLLALGEYEVYGIDLVNFDYPEADRIHFLQGDIRDRAAVQSLMPGMDYVVHCAAALPLYPPEEIYSTEVEGTHILLDEALKSGVKRFVHISSTAVYGVPDHHPLYETDEVVGVGPYGEAKIQAEAWCSRYREQGLYVSVIRPKSFVGPERLGVFAIFYAWAREGRNFPMIGDGKNRYQLLDVDDVCQAIVGCFHAEDDLANSTFNIGAAEYTTMKEDYQAVLDEAGFGKRIVCFPAGLVVFALKILEKLKLSPLYPWIYETASKDSFVSIEKAQHQLGFAPKYSNKEAMIRNYRWYLAHYSEISKEKGVTHRVPWDEKILKIAKLFF
jgi:nucleoside-diphosphate-sugar epimerase